MADQQRAHLIFSWWCGSGAFLRVLVLCWARHHAVITDGKSVNYMLVLAGLVALGAFFVRLSYHHLVPRLLVYTSGVGLHVAFPMSVLGSCNEALLIAAAMLIGELLAHPVEISRRRTHVSLHADALASLEDTPPPAFSVHPLTIRFADPRLERLYASRCFADSYPIVVAACLVMSVLFGLRAIAFPGTLVGSSMSIAALLSTLLARVGLQRMADQQRAHLVFSWLGCIVLLLWLVVIGWARHQAVIATGQPAEFVYVQAVLVGMCALSMRWSYMHLVPRLLIYTSTIAAHFAIPLSVLGPRNEALIFAASFVLVELLAHPVEMTRRISQTKALQQEVQIADAERQLAEAAAKSQATSRLYHIIKGKCGGAKAAMSALSESLPDIMQMTPETAVAQIRRRLHAPIAMLGEAEQWCHDRQVLEQLESGTYSSALTLCAVETLLSRLLRDDGEVVVDADSKHVFVDQTMLRLALEEGLSNAHKYQDPQTPLVMLAGLSEAPSRNCLHVQLCNTNRAGLPRLSSEECTRVFEAGYKAHTLSAMSDGVGLNTVAQAVRAAAGKAWLVRALWGVLCAPMHTHRTRILDAEHTSGCVYLALCRVPERILRARSRRRSTC
jgi:hypothetical protein